MQPLSNTETYSLSVLSIACISILVNAWRSDGEPLFASLAIAGVAFAFTYALIPWTGDVFIRRGYKGKDFSKNQSVEPQDWAHYLGESRTVEPVHLYQS
jgi:UDP-N-acetylglucosamine--dolichyl-phosphate N-acetylglucosaminephosphotransferase